MGKTYISMYSTCPFYIKEDSHNVYCEGVEEGTSTHLAFASSNHCAAYKRIRCRNGYKNCQIYKMLLSKYEEVKR